MFSTANVGVGFRIRDSGVKSILKSTFDASLRSTTKHNTFCNNLRCITSSFSTTSFNDNAFRQSGLNNQHSPQGIHLQTRTSQNSAPNPQSQIQQQQFQQQIQQWIAMNPKIAPYKAEEYLARLWEEQQELFSRWDQQQHQRQVSSMSAAGMAPLILLTTESVNLVLRAWCCSNNGKNAALRAERLLHWMEDLHPVGRDPADSSSQSNSLAKWQTLLPSPNYDSYAISIDSWSRAAVYESNNPNKDSLIRNEAKNTGRSKHFIPEATRVGFECAKRAEDLLMQMQLMHEQKLNNLSENQPQQGSHGGDSHLFYDSELQPDTNVFLLVLKAWAHIRGGTKASATRAMRILGLMEELNRYQSMHTVYDIDGDSLDNNDEGHLANDKAPKVQPNLESYKYLIYAWAHASHAPEGPDRAEEILRYFVSRSKEIKKGSEILPDEECFRIVMKAHAESARRGHQNRFGYSASSGERAQKVTELLDWMELLALRHLSSVSTDNSNATSHELAAPHPTTEHYRIALSAWAWSRSVNAPKEAEKILFRMIRASEITNSAGFTDDIISPHNGAKCRTMTKVRPETRDFNTVINCCAFARGVKAHSENLDDDEYFKHQLDKESIFLVAQGALEALLSSQHAQPDSGTFVGMIRACVNLLPNTPERDSNIIEIFRLAYRTPSPAKSSSSKLSAPSGGGCVDVNVLQQLRHALPSTQEYIRVREEFEEFCRKNSFEINK